MGKTNKYNRESNKGKNIIKIALIGSRGIPARYSGFETFYEQLAVRLVKRGHKVTVYNRSHFITDVSKRYRGVRIISLPSIPTKHLDTITHTWLATVHALTQRYNIVYYCIVGNSPLVWVPSLVGSKTLLNVDGEDWSREKWSGFARWYQKQCERIATKTANIIISDAHGVQFHYKQKYNADSIFVPYGANILHDARILTLKKWEIQPDEYYLYVGRFVPENAIDLLIRAFKKVKTKRKLVIVGDAPYMDHYKNLLKALAKEDKRIVFTGYAFAADYAQLSSHAYVYIQPSGINGTRPALLDQLGFGNCVLVRNSKVNMEVIDNCGCFFENECLENSLSEMLSYLDKNTGIVQYYRKKAQDRIINYYNWKWITSFYEDLFERMIYGKSLISYDQFIK